MYYFQFIVYTIVLNYFLYCYVLFYCLYCCIVKNISYNIVTYCFGSYNIVQLSKTNTAPCRPAPIVFEFSNTRTRTPWRTAWRLVGSGGHFRALPAGHIRTLVCKQDCSQNSQPKQRAAAARFSAAAGFQLDSLFSIVDNIVLISK